MSNIVEKIMVFVFVFSALVVLRELGDFIVSFVSNTKYQPSKGRLIGLGCAISYIFTIIFTGFEIL